MLSVKSKYLKPLKLTTIETLNNIKKKVKTEKPDKGVDTMIRVTLGNHARLSEIADNKANILLSINAIIISISLSTLIPKLITPDKAQLILPTFIMICFCVTGIVFAILSTRPKLSNRKFTATDIEQHKVNLLFFGNFSKMSLEEYMQAMNQLMQNKEDLYNAMIKDLYYLGIVLERKYRLLRITYTLFMIGTIVSVLSYIIAFNYK